MKKPELTVVERAQAMADRTRVNAWLDHIGETSPEGRAAMHADVLAEWRKPIALTLKDGKWVHIADRLEALK